MGVIRNIREQMVPLIVPGAGATVETANLTTDILYDKIKGVQATCTDPKAFQTSNFQNFEIGNLKIFDKGYEAKMLSAGQNTDIDKRWYKKLNLKAQGSTVNITYKDGSVAGTVYPYTVFVYLWLENPETSSE